MSSVLICANPKASKTLLKPFLNIHGFHDIRYADQPEQAISLCRQHQFTLILVDHPFIEDDHGISFLLKLHETSDAFQIVIAAQSQYDALCEQMERFGIFTMVKPIMRDVFSQFLAFVKAAQYRYGSMMKQQQQLVEQIKEIKLIDRAKCLLIENEYLSEEAAHKQIEKTAMNERVTRKAIAQRIIAEYEEGR